MLKVYWWVLLELQLWGIREAGLSRGRNWGKGSRSSSLPPHPINWSSVSYEPSAANTPSNSRSRVLILKWNLGGGTPCCLLQLPASTSTSQVSPRLLFHFTYQVACERDRARLGSLFHINTRERAGKSKSRESKSQSHPRLVSGSHPEWSLLKRLCSFFLTSRVYRTIKYKNPKR